MWIRIENIPDRLGDKPFPIPTEVRAVMNTLYDQGHEAYLVGGSVRDYFLNQPLKDYDVATSAEPEIVKSLFPKTIEVGRAFGVMKVITPSGREVEVATFRKEAGYRDHRHPTLVEFSDVEEDAKRRDFTINALYYDPKKNQVFDLFNGIKDLKEKKIRAIGKAQERFNEDALRLMRAVRFAARFQFTIENETRQAILADAPLIRKISVERVRDEIERILLHPSAKMAVQELDQLNLLENVMPEIAVGKLEQKKVWDQTLRVLTVIGQTELQEQSAFYWALFLLPTLRLHAIEKRDAKAKAIAARLKLSTEQSNLIAYLVRETPKFRDAFSMRDATLLKWMRNPSFELLMRFHELDSVSYDGNQSGLEFVRSIYADAKKKFDLKPLITGDDLVKLGMHPGRNFSEVLGTIEDLTLEGALNTPDEALEYVLKHFVK